MRDGTSPPPPPPPNHTNTHTTLKIKLGLNPCGKKKRRRISFNLMLEEIKNGQKKKTYMELIPSWSSFMKKVGIGSFGYRQTPVKRFHWVSTIALFRCSLMRLIYDKPCNEVETKCTLLRSLRVYFTDERDWTLDQLSLLFWPLYYPCFL